MEYPKTKKGKLYLVGGNVRDILLKRQSKDMDFVLVGSTEKEAKEEFKDWIFVGKKFPVFRKIIDGKQVDIALARKEIRTGFGHSDFEAFTDDITLEEDLRRRDLRINGMAMDSNGTIIDPFGGRKDLDNKLLRHISEAFGEDALRVYRVARFSSQLGFYVHSETIIAMNEMKEYLKYLPKDRVREEFLMACKGKFPYKFIEALQLAGCNNIHFCCSIITRRVKGLIRKFKNKNLLELCIIPLLFINSNICNNCQSIFTKDMQDFRILFELLGYRFNTVEHIIRFIEFGQRKFNLITEETIINILKIFNRYIEIGIYTESKEAYESVKSTQFKLIGKELGMAIKGERIDLINNILKNYHIVN